MIYFKKTLYHLPTAVLKFLYITKYKKKYIIIKKLKMFTIFFKAYVFSKKASFLIFQVETGREELKKEREIMQLVAGLQLNSDDVERREVPPHMIRARHGPRYGLAFRLLNSTSFSYIFIYLRPVVAQRHEV